MISSSTTSSVIAAWLQSIKMQCPAICPEYFMSDNDSAEHKAINDVYPDSRILLCWWHVIKDWKRKIHGVVPKNEQDALFQKLKFLLTTSRDFEVDVKIVQQLANPEFNLYFERTWLPKKDLWAFEFRQDRSILQSSNTNMLIER